MQTRTSFGRLRPRALGRMNNVRRFKFPWTYMYCSPDMLHETPNVNDTTCPSSASLTLACLQCVGAQHLHL